MIRRVSPASRRWLALGVLAALAVAGAGGCRQRAQVGGSNSPKAQEARKAAEGYVIDAVNGAAVAQLAAHPEQAKKEGLLARFNPWHKSPSSSPTPSTKSSGSAKAAPAKAAPAVAARPDPVPRSPRATGPVVIRERVASEIPCLTVQEAEEATLAEAGEWIARKFRDMDPPLDYHPSEAAVKTEYLRGETRRVRPPTEAENAVNARLGYGPDRVYVEYTVEVTADQVRELRTRDRVGAALRVFGGVAAVALAGFAFLRLDEWSKGYLTSWLAFIAAALTGAAAVALVFA